MKKSILSLIISILLLVCLTACEVGEIETTTLAPVEICEKLNGFLNVTYQTVRLDIATKTGAMELSSSYLLSKDNVEYTVEKMNRLPIDGEMPDTPSGYKTTLRGTAVIVDGQVTKLDGDEVTLPSYEELRGQFHFDEGNFENVFSNRKTFSADVISPSAFYGAEVDMENMHIEVAYSQNALVSIVITYQTVHSSVTVTYQFQK